MPPDDLDHFTPTGEMGPSDRTPHTGATANTQTGDRIGPYKLLQRLGVGGMGEVWMAEQTAPVRRQVAIKLIKLGMDSKQVLGRFEAERQALTLMDHPNIARVLDAGTTSNGRPYFVMELVKGVPVTDYCDEARLTMRERLELFVPICHAVQHAHQKGIIHRDLKPSNVLVTLYDGRPVPKVIDFGLAKALHQRLTEQTMFTAIGTVVGTPEYMAPEQAEMNALDIDTRADIYSLGVLLYEMLTDSTPFGHERFRAASYAEMIRIIKEEEPLMPSKRLSSVETLPDVAGRRRTDSRRLTQELKGELDWVVMKCLDKERTRRYETANGLAEDVQRYLKDEPVIARPASTSYRMRRFIGRHRFGVATATAFVLLLLAGLAGTTWGLLEVRRQRDAATASAAAEKEARESTEAVIRFVENRIFAAARPEGQEGGLGRDVTLRKAIDSALPALETTFKNQPSVNARLRLTLGLSLWYLGEERLAVDQYTQALTAYEKVYGHDHRDTLMCRNNLAASLNDLGRYAEALKLHEETWARRKATLGPDHPDTLMSMTNVALTYSNVGRYADALTLDKEALALKQATLGPDHPDTLMSMNNVGVDYMYLGQYSEALKWSEEALALHRVKLGDDHPVTLKSMNNVAYSLSRLGRFAEALKLREETLTLRRAKLGHHHPDTLVSMTNLAMSYSDVGRHDEALKLREETLKLHQTKLGRDHPATLTCMTNLSLSLADTGRHEEALKLREEALLLHTAKLGRDHPYTLICMNNLAISYFQAGRPADELKLREEMLPLQQAKLGRNHVDTLWTMERIAYGYSNLGRYVEALKLFEEELEGRKATQGMAHPQTVVGIYNIACTHSLMTVGADDRAKQADVAMDWLKQAVKAGYRDVEHMKKDSDLDPLRDREDFKKLIVELEAKLATEKK